MSNNDSSITAFFGGDTAGLEKAVDRSSAVIGKFQSAFANIGLTIGAGAVIGFFKSVIDKGSQLQNLSDELGVSTNAIQSFGYAVRLAGGDVNEAGRVMRTTRNSVDMLAEGNEKTRETFAKLGLSQKDLIGIPLEQALEKIARGFVQNKDRAGAYSALIDIVGSRSAKLTAVIEDLGRNGFGTLESSARRAGQLIDTETIVKLNELGNKVETAKTIMQHAGSSIVLFFHKVSEGLGVAAANFENLINGREKWESKSNEAAEKVTKAVDKVTEAVKGQIASVKDFAAFNEAEAKREIERLDLKGDRQAKLNAMLALAKQFIGEASTYQENSREQLELVGKAQATILEYDREIAKQEKDTAEERERAGDEHIKAMDKLTELQFERLSAEDKTVKLFAQASEITINIEKMKREGKDTTLAHIALLETQNKLSEVGKTLSTEQLEAALKKAGATQQETDAVKALIALISGGLKPPTEAVTQSVIDQAAAWDRITGRVKTVQGEVIKLQGIIAGVGTSRNFGGETNEVLEEMMRRNRTQIARLQFQDAGEPDSRKYNAGEIARLTLENQNLSRELNLRDVIGQINDTQGRGAALRAFPGSPEAFDRFLTLAEGQDATAKLAQKDLSDIRSLLRDTFRK